MLSVEWAVLRDPRGENRPEDIIKVLRTPSKVGHCNLPLLCHRGGPHSSSSSGQFRGQPEHLAGRPVCPIWRLFFLSGNINNTERLPFLSKDLSQFLTLWSSRGEFALEWLSFPFAISLVGRPIDTAALGGTSGERRMSTAQLGNTGAPWCSRRSPLT